MGAAESQEYLQGKIKIYFAGKKAGDAILDSKEEEAEPDRKVQMELDFKREISGMQLEIEDSIKGLSKLLGAATITSDGYKGAGEMLKVVEQKLNNDYKNMVMKCDDVLEPTVAKEEKEKAGTFVGTNRPKVGDLKVKLLMKTPVKEEKVQTGNASQGSGVRDDRQSSGKRTVKTAPIPVPKWDGKTRSFPRFKVLWEENIIPFHEPSALHMMLVEALPEEILGAHFWQSNRAFL